MLDFARPMYALYVGGMGAKGKNFYNDLACQYGYEEEAAEIQDLYLGGKKKEAEALVPDRVARGRQPGRPRVLRQGAHRGLPRGRRHAPPGHARLRRPGRHRGAGQGMGVLTPTRSRLHCSPDSIEGRSRWDWSRTRLRPHEGRARASSSRRSSRSCCSSAARSPTVLAVHDDDASAAPSPVQPPPRRRRPRRPDRRPDREPDHASPSPSRTRASGPRSACAARSRRPATVTRSRARSTR